MPEKKRGFFESVFGQASHPPFESDNQRTQRLLIEPLVKPAIKGMGNWVKNKFSSDDGPPKRDKPLMRKDINLPLSGVRKR